MSDSYSNDILKSHQDVIERVLAQIKPDWFMNLVSINEGNSYLICKNPDVQEWVAGLLDVKFENSVAKANRLWLRKEIIKQGITAATD